MPAQLKKVEEMPEKEPLGLDSMTAGETAMAEKLAAQSIVTLGNERFPQGAIIGALGYVLFKRTSPKVTYADYMATYTLGQITEQLALTVPDDEDDEVGKDEPTSAS